MNENNENISIVSVDGNVVPYEESRCMPSLFHAKVQNGIGHILTMGMFILLEELIGSLNSDEVCIAGVLQEGLVE